MTVDPDVETSVRARQHFGQWRRWVRDVLLKRVILESKMVAGMQQRVRGPSDTASESSSERENVVGRWLVDVGCGRVLAALGTHSMFVAGLPALFWLVDANINTNASDKYLNVNADVNNLNVDVGLHVTLSAAACVVVANLFKDCLCLPRPSSPPVLRLLNRSSTTHHFEYGFPSTHVANAVSIALYIILFYNAYSYSNYSNDLFNGAMVVAAALLYAFAMGASRMLAGMHSLSDVVAGALIGIVVTVIEYVFLATNHSLRLWVTTAPFLNIACVCAVIVAALLLLHPDPVEPCPCFEDSVCFVGVVVGLFIGSSHWISILSYTTITLTTSHSIFGCLQRALVGYTAVFVVRAACKRLLLHFLKPVWSRFGWPIPFSGGHPIKPKGGSRTHLHSHSHNDSVSFASIDVDAIKKQPRYRIPRYSLELVVKLITYAAIGYTVVCVAPLLFHVMGIK